MNPYTDDFWAACEREVAVDGDEGGVSYPTSLKHRFPGVDWEYLHAVVEGNIDEDGEGDNLAEYIDWDAVRREVNASELRDCKGDK